MAPGFPILTSLVLLRYRIPNLRAPTRIILRLYSLRLCSPRSYHKSNLSTRRLPCRAHNIHLPLHRGPSMLAQRVRLYLHANLGSSASGSALLPTRYCRLVNLDHDVGVHGVVLDPGEGQRDVPPNPMRDRNISLCASPA